MLPLKGNPPKLDKTRMSYSLSLGEDMGGRSCMGGHRSTCLQPEVGHGDDRYDNRARIKPLSASRPSLALPSALSARPTQRLPHSTMIGELKSTALKAGLDLQQSGR